MFLVISGCEQSLGKLLFWLNGIFQLELVRTFWTGPKPSAKHGWCTGQGEVDFGLGADTICGACEDGYSGKDDNVIWLFGVLRMGSPHFMRCIWVRKRVRSCGINSCDGSQPMREHQGREGLLRSSDARGCFIPESGDEECQKSKNITLQEIVINLPCPSLLRTKLYFTLHCATKPSSAATVH